MVIVRDLESTRQLTRDQASHVTGGLGPAGLVVLGVAGYAVGRDIIGPVIVNQLDKSNVSILKGAKEAVDNMNTSKS
jgi:hypothetical protein